MNKLKSDCIVAHVLEDKLRWHVLKKILQSANEGREESDSFLIDIDSVLKIMDELEKESVMDWADEQV